MRLFKITQQSVDSLTRRILTMWTGRGNGFTAVQYGPYGDDSAPVADSIAAYSETALNGKEICLGVMSKNAKAEPGEKRLYCTDENGNFKFNIWLRASGEVLIGDSEAPADYTNYAVKYNELLADLTELKATVNQLVNALNIHSHLDPVSGALPPPTAVPNVIPVVTNTTDFTDIKNEKIKYPE